MQRLIAGAAGLAGAAGVALSAFAAHAQGSPNLDIAARFLLVHAAALLGVAALSGGALSPRLAALAALVTTVGLALFCGDLVRRATAGSGLFAMAAPAGGFALIAGWLLVALAAAVGGRG